MNEMLTQVLEAVEAWERRFRPFTRHPSTRVDAAALANALKRYTDRLEGNYPFFHPDYAGQMLKPPHPVAQMAYAAAQRINPNNHALDGGPPTSEMEVEVVGRIAAAVGLPEDGLGHLTSSGTLANLEALFIAREEHPDKGVLASEMAHYTHSRMAHVLRMPFETVPADTNGRMDVQALRERLAKGGIGTVVVTTGTTGMGAVDPLHEILPVCREFGVRVHVDAAYGGFFAILAQAHHPDLPLPSRNAFLALGEADSVALDPHKHGLQPYGCGMVYFANSKVGKHYLHDSPYTYYSSKHLHLGEISLECSRAGAAAGALWLTMEVLSPEADRGLGPILAACLRAARKWNEALATSERLVELTPQPDLDIVLYAPAATSFEELDALSGWLFDASMLHPDPIFLALYKMKRDWIALRLNHLEGQLETPRILRSVLMKPEHEHEVSSIVARLNQLLLSKQEL